MHPARSQNVSPKSRSTMASSARPASARRRAPDDTSRVLVVGDDEADASILLRELWRGGYRPDWDRVDSADSMLAAVCDQPWDVVACDFTQPEFNALSALRLLRVESPEVPFIIVSDTIEEDLTVAALKEGADDVITKGHLDRFLPAVDREIRRVSGRRLHRTVEDRIWRSEEKFRALVQTTDGMVFTVDQDGRFDGVHGRSLDLAGVTPEGLVGRQADQIFAFGDPARHRNAQARAMAGESVRYEWSLPGAGRERHFQTVLSPLRSFHGQIKGLMGVAREITAQKEARAQLLISDRMLTIGTLAAEVAHEINNPLAAVVSNLDYVLSGPKAGPTPAAAREGGALGTADTSGPFDDESRLALEDARQAADRVREMVLDLKLASRVEREPRRAPIDVEGTLDFALRMARHELQQRARLDKHYAGVPAVEGDESRLGQVFINLLMNAAQALPAGQADHQVVRVRTGRTADGQVLVEIEDTGPGIALEHLRQLFTPFFTTKPAGVGTGLGLSICHRIVAEMGGRIEVDTEVGRGTTFRVLLPALPTNPPASALR